MLQINYDRKYVCQQIDKEIEQIKQYHPYGFTRQDQLLIDAATVQILLGNDEAALELLDKCFGGFFLVQTWERAAEETKYF